MSGPTVLTGRSVHTGRPARITVQGGRITAVEEPTESVGAAAPWIAPGLIDLQVNGYGGHDVNAPDVTAEDIVALVRTQWAAGVSAVCPTIITAAEERIHHALRAIGRARATDPLVARSIVGVHVEGPHLAAADGPRGAHDAAQLRPPDPAEFARWQATAGGLIRIVTLAPELPGGPDYIRAVTAAGAIAAIGHTAARPADIAAAARAGARLSTHLGNGAHAVLPRHPNYLWAQLAEQRLTASLIADGRHLDRDVLTVMLRAKGIDRCVLVSDTVALAGGTPGQYDTPVGGRVELTADGRLVLGDGSGLLAGATRTLSQCLAWLVDTGRPLSDAITLAATNPARLLGLTDRGRLAVGAAADLTLFRLDRDQPDIVATLVAGSVVAGQVSEG